MHPKYKWINWKTFCDTRKVKYNIDHKRRLVILFCPCPTDGTHISVSGNWTIQFSGN